MARFSGGSDTEKLLGPGSVVGEMQTPVRNRAKTELDLGYVNQSQNNPRRQSDAISERNLHCGL